MANLRLCMLGGLEVIRDGTPLELPPSRKTRGLLAYLALQERTLRRDQLCELLWEIPDDPRGSLRWSLSKLRKLVDTGGRPRIIADRSSVAFDTSDVAIDVCELQDSTGAELPELPVAVIEERAERYRGVFLEGLDLPDFHDYYTWCIGERERAGRAQASLLRTLLEKLADDPERALPHASSLVTLQPLDEDARARLVTMLLRMGRKQEAEQQYRLGLKKLQEAGIDAGNTGGGALQQAWRSAAGARRTAPPQVTTGPDPKTTARDLAGRDRDLVGRDAEMTLLAEMVNALPTAGRAAALLIRGDPGLGKSRLLQAAAVFAREVGAGILKASAFESELVRPFAAWNDALRRAMPDNPASDLLTGGERISRDQVFTCLSEVLTTATAERPVVVLFDDVQWCDESSAAAMHYVLRMNRREPILVVGAGREQEMQGNAAVQQCVRGLRQEGLLRELRLEPMPAGDLRALIELSAPGADAERLARESGGNPLLALELARAEREGDSGNSLSELVRERIARLDSEAITVLDWSAVLAPRISLEKLAQATGLERLTIDRAIELAEQQGILHPGEQGYRFSHDLIADSIYREIPASRQRAMHRRVAELLEVDAALDLSLAAGLAHHAPRSGDPGLAARAMVCAGRLCLRFYANPDALELFQRGMDFAAQLEDAERVRLTLELHDIRLTAAPLEDWESSVEEYIELAESALDHGDQPHARLGYQMASYMRWLHGQWSDAQRDSLQAERVARGADEEARIFGIAEAAKCLALLERDLSRADAMSMEARSLALRSNVQCPAVPLSQSLLRYYEGRFEEAVDFLEESRTLCKMQGDRISEFMANEYLTMIEVERGDYAAGLVRSRALVKIGERLREGSERPFALAMQALCRYGLDGEDGELEQALPALRKQDAKQRLIYLLNRAAGLDRAGGRVESARLRATEALELARLMERPSELLLANVNLAALEPRGKAGDNPYREAAEVLADGAVAEWARQWADILTEE